jgi:hypothetical protein
MDCDNKFDRDTFKALREDAARQTDRRENGPTPQQYLDIRQAALRRIKSEEFETGDHQPDGTVDDVKPVPFWPFPTVTREQAQALRESVRIKPGQGLADWLRQELKAPVFEVDWATGLDSE